MDEMEKLVEFSYDNLQAVRRAQKYYLAVQKSRLSMVR
jgi:hypothetical protein